jgi:hypothetical protein
MPFNKNLVPRKGQADLIKHLETIKAGGQLTVQWPMGYGKYLGFALVWKNALRRG